MHTYSSVSLACSCWRLFVLLVRVARSAAVIVALTASVVNVCQAERANESRL